MATSESEIRSSPRVTGCCRLLKSIQPTPAELAKQRSSSEIGSLWWRCDGIDDSADGLWFKARHSWRGAKSKVLLCWRLPPVRHPFCENPGHERLSLCLCFVDTSRKECLCTRRISSLSGKWAVFLLWQQVFQHRRDSCGHCCRSELTPKVDWLSLVTPRFR